MGAAVTYPNVRTARDNFKALLDASDASRPAVVTRDNRRTAMVDADQLLNFLMAVRPAGVQAVAENSGWSLFMPGLPVAAEGNTMDEATDELIAALHDYAEAWVERLRHAQNHAGNWGLVQIVSLASDEQLREWISR